ncbi:MAG TPA: GntR family transcriptional regulator [Thermomicrobiales bacterium]|nr:GntR family transcriptional regulator [Thermomicrobiales bacterium]
MPGHARHDGVAETRHDDGENREERRPLHRQIADALQREIDRGELRPGDSLPSETDLMRRFGVSRGTVRQARATLRACGAIAGSQGRHFIVRALPLTQPLGELVSFTAWARCLGKTPTGHTVSFIVGSADDDEAAALQTPPQAPVWRLLRVRFADGEPLMIERTTFPDAIGRLLQGVDLDRSSVYAELGRRGVAIDAARHLLDAVPASAQDAALLGVAPGAALLRVQRVAVGPDGIPVERADDRYRGDRTNFAIENDAKAAGLVRRLA